VRQIGNHDFPAIGEQGPGGRKANPGGATGDDCHPAIGHCALPLFVNAPVFAAGLDMLLVAQPCIEFRGTKAHPNPGISRAWYFH
jgi:hypothetical protein